MSHFVLEEDKCNSCTFCTTECPMGVLAMTDDGYPALVEKNEEICIYCGHCVTACPFGALSVLPTHNEQALPGILKYGVVPIKISPDDCLPVRRYLLPKPEQVEELARTRRIIRTYKNKPVDRQLLSRLMDEVIRYAPSGHNTRVLNWLFVESKDKLNELTDLTVDWMRMMVRDKRDSLAHFDAVVLERIIEAWETTHENRIFRRAPELVILHGPKWVGPASPASYITLTTFDLVAYSHGLGTAWAGYFLWAASDNAAIKRALNVPEEHLVYGAMMLGYPDLQYDRIPVRPEVHVEWV